MRKQPIFTKLTVLLTLGTFISLIGLSLSSVSAGTSNSCRKQAVSSSSDFLSEEEKAGLQFMVQEEKLARDVYLELYALWGQRTFDNIANSEQRHMDSLLRIATLYDVEAEIVIGEVGVFSFPELQELYEQLIARGEVSLVDALIVGATIEEVDILDLEDYIANTTNSDLITVYTNLQNGSFNHLRSFVRVLSRFGYDYQPQYLSDELFEEIMSMRNGNGSGHGGGF